MEPTIKIEFTIAEANLILRVLGKHPFDEVVELIQKIKLQGEAQIAQAQPPVDQPPTDATS